MQTNQRKNRTEGMALLLAIVFLLAMGTLVALTATRAISNMNHESSYVDVQKSYLALDSGFAYARAELSELAKATYADDPIAGADEDGLIGLPYGYDLSNFDPANFSTYPNFGDPGVTPWAVPTSPDMQFFALSRDLGADLTGVGTPGATRYFSTYSFARIFRDGELKATRRAEEIVEITNVNIWQNALFGGEGQVGGMINGNVDIHGSIHILGTNLGPGDVALDISGNSSIHNSYEGLASDLLNRIPNLPQTVVQGETVSTLNAEMRVKNGLVAMSGNSKIGEPQDAGNAFKETMDAVYVTDGWTGNSIDGNGDPRHVYSDNGWNEAYDLGDTVSMPMFEDEVEPGVEYRGDFYNEFDANLAAGLQYIHDGEMRIETHENYYWNATTGDEAVDVQLGTGLMPDRPAVDTMLNRAEGDQEYFVWWDATANLLIVNGRIPIDGDLRMDRNNQGQGSGHDLTMNYLGKGSFLAFDADGSGDGGEVEIRVSLLTDNFPDSNLLGFMAEDRLRIVDSSQREVMGGFYSQNELEVNRQTVVVGSLVANDFDLSNQVPSVYQVPALGAAWSGKQRMIGADPILHLQTVSWREIGAQK